MTELPRKLRRSGIDHMMFWCPACNCAHQIRIESAGAPGWRWNGDAAKPTFLPSIKVEGTLPLTEEERERALKGINNVLARRLVCHSFVTDGRIRFLDDSTHELRGQTLDLPDFDPDGHH